MHSDDIDDAQYILTALCNIIPYQTVAPCKNSQDTQTPLHDAEIVPKRDVCILRMQNIKF